MNNLPLLEESLELLLQHTEEIVRVPAYYHSRIMYKPEPQGPKRPGSFLLGPYLELWKQVPVNKAGKLLLTYELLGNTVPHLDHLREVLPELAKRKHPQEGLEEESGFRYKNPLPGISRYQLQDIFCRYMLQFNRPDLPMGAPLELVVQELREGKSLHQRASLKYNTVREKLRQAVAEATGTDGLYHVPDLSINAGQKFYPDWKPLQPPVTFRVEQEQDMRFTVWLAVEVHVRNISVHGVTGRRVSTVGLNDLMLDCIAEFTPLLEQHGFTKLKASTSVSGGGLEATFASRIDSPDDVLAPDYLASFGRLVQRMYSIIRQQGLLPDNAVYIR